METQQDILVFNTEENIPKIEEPKVLSVVNELHPLMLQTMPDYKLALPNQRMTKLILDMRKTLEQYNGIGLSANQCGVAVRMFIIGSGETTFVCINPRVIGVSENLVKSGEGCLSFPGLYLNIKRPEWVLAEYTTQSGKVEQFKFFGLTARCFLHELDHMNGVVFTEHVGHAALTIARENKNKLMKKIRRTVEKNHE